MLGLQRVAPDPCALRVEDRRDRLLCAAGGGSGSFEQLRERSRLGGMDEKLEALVGESRTCHRLELVVRIEARLRWPLPEQAIGESVDRPDMRGVDATECS